MGRVLARLGLGGLIVLLAFVIGCGGDDEESSSGGDTTAAEETPAEDTTAEAEEPKPITEEDFAKEADALCATRTKDIAKVLAEDGANQETAVSEKTLASPEALEEATAEVGKTTDELADIKREITKELAKLETPDPKGLDDLVASRNQAADDLNKLADAWRTYGKNPTQETSDAVSESQEANIKSATADRKVAEKLGLKVCGQPVKPA